MTETSSNWPWLHRSTTRQLTDEEWNSETRKKLRDEFDASVKQKLGGKFEAKDLFDEEMETPTFDFYSDDHGEDHRHVADEEQVTPEGGDEYVNAEVNLPHGEGMVTGKVIGHKGELDGTLRGLRSDNPLLDTRSYVVEFPDSEVSEYAANVIAENMWAQCDLDGQQRIILDSIMDHKTNGHAVAMADRYINVKGKQHLRKTTRGWRLCCCQWKDGSTSWNRMADLKESHPIEVAEYAVAMGIDHEPAFAWWVPHTLRKRNRIIAAVKKRCCLRSLV